MMIELYKSITINQFLAALQTLEQSIQRTPDEIWGADHIDGQVNQVVFHTLFFTDLYLCCGEDGFKKQEFHLNHADFFQDYEEMEDRAPVNFYKREECRLYLDFCVEKVKSVVESETEETLRGDSGFPWRKTSRAEIHLYNLRHVQHHAAQLGLRHQLTGGPPLRWVSKGT